MRGVNACLDNFQPPLKIPEITAGYFPWVRPWLLCIFYCWSSTA